MKIIRIKRLWNSIASIRDYTLDDLIKRGETLRIECEDEYIELTANQLKEKMFQISKKKFKSRFGQDYTLYDIPWKDAQKINKQLDIFS